MDFRKTGSQIVVRIDEGEELISTLKSFCKNEKIYSALITGIGAARKAEIGHWDPKTGKYDTKIFEGLLEIVALNGNVTLKDSEPLIHLYISVGISDYSTKSGHLMSAEIFPTCELVLLPLATKITRKKDEKTGLFLQTF